MQIRRLSFLPLSCLLSGCGITAPVYRQLGAHPQPSAGSVIVVVKTVIDPSLPAPPMKIPYSSHSGHAPSNVQWIVTRDLSNEVRHPETTPRVAIDEVLESNLGEMSLVEFHPGTSYIRYGIVYLRGRFTNYVRMEGPHGYQYDLLYLLGEITVEVPADARAVYLGTLHYARSGDTAHLTRITDDYEEARGALARQGIPGLQPDLLVKRLARPRIPLRD